MTPTNPAEFIGKTHIIARVLFNSAAKFKADRSLPPAKRRHLFTGPPGNGKTSLAMALASHVTGNSIASILAKTALNVEWVNGQSWTVDMVRQWSLDGHYLPLYGDRLVKIVDEIDSISPAAANEALSYLDALPGHVMLIATSNKPVNALPDRMQSRFAIHSFAPVPQPDIAAWLSRQFPTLDTALQISRACDGNVRAAATDAMQRLEYVEALA